MQLNPWYVLAMISRKASWRNEEYIDVNPSILQLCLPACFMLRSLGGELIALVEKAMTSDSSCYWFYSCEI
jgi:hypothetical protein